MTISRNVGPPSLGPGPGPRVLELSAATAAGPETRPLSFGQERLLLLARLFPESTAHNISVAYHLRGPLDAAALARAFEEIARRHEILRTTFREIDGCWAQVVAPERPPELQRFSTEGLSPAGRAERAREIARREANAPFDIGAAPPWRAALTRHTDQEHDLQITMHHIISDAWSFQVVCHELEKLYESAGAYRFGPLPIQYGDFAEEQRRELVGAPLDRAVRYWRGRLDEGVEAPRLPGRSPAANANAPAGRAGRRELELSPELTGRLKAISLQEKASLFMALLAGFHICLHALTSQTRALIFAPVVGRHRPRYRPLVGYFNNLLPLYLDLDGQPSFREALRRARAVVLDGFRHQDLPFQQIVGSPRLARMKLNRLLFSMDMNWPPELALKGLTADARAIDPDAVDFDVSISLWMANDRVRGAIRYDPAALDDATAAELVAVYTDQLERCAERPDEPLSTPSHSQSRVEERSSGRAAYCAPEGPIEARITTLWEEALGVRPIGLDDDVLALGASSLTIAQLCEQARREFSSNVPLAAMFQARSVRKLAALLRANGPIGPVSSLTAIQPGGQRPPLFLCEAVGIYYPLTRRLSADQPVYALYRTIGDDVRCAEELAAHYVEEIRGVRPHGPYYLGGVSFGGLVALMMAQQLRLEGEAVALLALFDTPGPGAYAPRPLPGRLVGHLKNVIEFGPRYAWSKAGRLARRARRLWRGVRRAGKVMGIDEHGPIDRRLLQGEELREHFWNVARASRISAYPGRITLFALEQRGAGSDSLFDPNLGTIDPYLGWGRIALEGVDLHKVPGGHVSMFQEPHVQALAAALERTLEAARFAAANPLAEIAPNEGLMPD